MADATVDILQDMISCREENGALVELRRSVLVQNLRTASYAAVMEALDSIGLIAGSVPGLYTNLILTQRNARMVEGDPTSAIVELVYEHFDNAGQDLDNPTHGQVFVKSRSSLQSIQTQKDADDTNIEVRHTFPDGTATYQDADGNTLPADKDYPGQTVTQGAEAYVLTPQEIITATGLYSTARPNLLVRATLGHVNSAEWMNGAAGTWLCTAADYEEFDLGAVTGESRVRFTFEFQYEADGWQPQVVFIDERVGRPPPALVANTGYKTITWYPTCDFAQYMDLMR